MSNYVRIVSPEGRWIVNATSKEQAEAQYKDRTFLVRVSQYHVIRATVKAVSVYGGVIIAWCNTEPVQADKKDRTEYKRGNDLEAILAGRLIPEGGTNA